MSELTGLRNFLRRSGGMMGWASRHWYIDAIFAARSAEIVKPGAAICESATNGLFFSPAIIPTSSSMSFTKTTLVPIP